MTTFQALIDAFLHSMALMLPISQLAPDAFLQNILHWPIGSAEILCLILCMGTLVYLIFFRFDWLGLISAFFRSLLQPLTLKSEQRSLDQHTLLFLILIFIPSTLLRHFTAPLFAENEIWVHPLVNAVLTAVLAFSIYFAHRWNKRINGLNHLKLADGFFIGALSLLSVHPAIPYVGMLWIGFALRNYHYEAVFKYASLALGLSFFTALVESLASTGFVSSLDAIGHLNSISILVVSFVTFWMVLENMQRNLSEGTYRVFQWMNSVIALFFALLYFLKDMT